MKQFYKVRFNNKTIDAFNWRPLKKLKSLSSLT